MGMSIVNVKAIVNYQDYCGSQLPQRSSAGVSLATPMRHLITSVQATSKCSLKRKTLSASSFAPLLAHQSEQINAISLKKAAFHQHQLPRMLLPHFLLILLLSMIVPSSIALASRVGIRVGIIGGGPSGFFAAISLAERHPDVDITILEASNKLLNKVIISGGGRCNLLPNTELPTKKILPNCEEATRYKQGVRCKPHQKH